MKYHQRPLKIKRSISLDEDIIKQIDEIAESEDRSFSSMVNLILKEYLSKSPAKLTTF